MIVTEKRLDPNQFILARPDFIDSGVDTQDRAVGWHVGECIKGTLSEAHGKGEEDGDLAPMTWKWIMLLGFCWEHYMVQRVPSESGTLWQPGEIGADTGVEGNSKDGRSKRTLYGNADGYSPVVTWEGKGDSNGLMVPVLEEFKFTKQSSNKGPDHTAHTKWRMQVKAYLKMLQEVHGSEHRWARIWVCFVNDDYKFGGDGPEPYVACWWFEFTQQEIDDNWKVMVSWLNRQ